MVCPDEGGKVQVSSGFVFAHFGIDEVQQIGGRKVCEFDQIFRAGMRAFNLVRFRVTIKDFSFEQLLWRLTLTRVYHKAVFDQISEFGRKPVKLVTVCPRD